MPPPAYHGSFHGRRTTCCLSLSHAALYTIVLIEVDNPFLSSFAFLFCRCFTASGETRRSASPDCVLPWGCFIERTAPPAEGGHNLFVAFLCGRYTFELLCLYGWRTVVFFFLAFFLLLSLCVSVGVYVVCVRVCAPSRLPSPSALLGAPLVSCSPSFRV